MDEPKDPKEPKEPKEPKQGGVDVKTTPEYIAMKEMLDKQTKELETVVKKREETKREKKQEERKDLYEDIKKTIAVPEENVDSDECDMESNDKFENF